MKNKLIQSILLNKAVNLLKVLLTICTTKIFLVLILIILAKPAFSIPIDSTKANTQSNSVLKQKTEHEITDSVKKAVIDSLIKDKEKQGIGKVEPDRSVYISTIIVLSLISIAICVFLFNVANSSPKDGKSALGLPDGSIRALIALFALVFYILGSIAFAFFEGSNTTPLAVDVSKTLGDLVIAVSAFYFGSKTAEQAAKTANDKGNDTLSNDVPNSIIQEAVLANKNAWITTYGCISVEVGKKSTDDVIHNTDCIVFKVVDKNVTPPGAKPIPPTITYTSQGKDYIIPTDVQQVPPIVAPAPPVVPPAEPILP